MPPSIFDAAIKNERRTDKNREEPSQGSRFGLPHAAMLFRAKPATFCSVFLVRQCTTSLLDSRREFAT